MKLSLQGNDVLIHQNGEVLFLGSQQELLQEIDDAQLIREAVKNAVDFGTLRGEFCVLFLKHFA